MQIQRKLAICPPSPPPVAVANVGHNPPSEPIEGLLWVDTSEDGFVLKIYDRGSWRIVQADVYLTKIDGGSL
jgi:hypothetical protein